MVASAASAARQRGRARGHQQRVWVREHVSEGHIVRGHWRSNPDQRRAGGTVLEDDWRQHIEQLLGQHATAVDRAAQVKAALMQYAAALAGS